MKNKKRILHVIYSLDIGGAERDLVLKLNVLKHKYDFSIITLAKKGGFTVDLKDIPIFCLNMKHKLDFKAIFKFYRLLFKIKPDIVHAHLFNASLFVRLLTIFFNLKRVITVQMIRPKRPFWQKIVDFLLQFFTHKIISASFAIKKQLIKEGILKHKIQVIYNGFLKEIMDKKNNFLREKYNIKDDVFIVGSISRLDKDKGIDILIKCANILNNKNIVFFVFGDGKERKRLENMIAYYGIRDIFFMPGFTNEPLKVLCDFDLFVLPSRTEGLGIAILEALSVKKVVIASNVGGIPEIIQNGKNGILFESENYKELASKIELLLKDKELYNMLKKEAENTLEKFKIEKVSHKLDRLYDVLLL